MKQIATFISAAFTCWSLFAGDIAWQIGATSGKDTDVRSDGKLVYAYASGDCVVNGVKFMGFPAAANWLGDVAVSEAMGLAGSAYWAEKEGTAGVSADYKTILKGGCYTNPNKKSVTYTLNNLVVGKRYLVQWWFNDMRAGRETANADIGGQSLLRLEMNGNVLGANACGMFTADAATQAFSVSYNIEGQINALQLRCLDDAKITWVSSETSGGDDVVTDGVLEYAYVPGSAARSVRGVSFSPVTGSNLLTFGTNVSFSLSLGSPYTGFFDNSEMGYDESYAGLLGCGFYRDNSGIVKRHVTLHNLRPGEWYAVQLWVADNRAAVYGDRWMTIDDQVTLRHCGNSTASGTGSFAVGRFKAMGTEQSFVCVHSRRGEKALFDQELFGAIQLRSLRTPPGCISWTKGASSADGGVDGRGVPLYAYAANTVMVGGTSFAKASGGDTMGDSVLFSASFDVAGNAFVTHPENFTEEGKNLLKGAYYLPKNNAQSITVTLKGLTVGRRYLVQIWSCDDRDRSGAAHVVGGVKVNYNALGGGDCVRGEWAKGVFVAAANSQSFALTELSSPEWAINAIQVREIDAVGSEISWTGKDITENATETIASEGSLLYAYGMSTTSFTAGGVTFATVDTTKLDWGSGDVTIDGLMSRSTGYYSGSAISGDYRNIIACGLFDGASGAPTKTFTLGKLKAGHRYLVQYFVSDTRAPAFGKRTATFEDKTVIRYGNDGDGAHPFGMTATGTFIAEKEKKSFTVSYMSTGTQINALQVRDLGFEGIVWAGGSTGEWSHDGAGWATNGTSLAGETLWDSSKGPNVSAEIPDGTKLDLSADIWAGTVFSDGEIVLGEYGTEKKLTVAGEVVAPHAIVNAAWGAQDVNKSMPGEMVLAGAMDEVRFLTVGGGVCTIASKPKRNLKVSVFAPGKVQIAAGSTMNVDAVSGNGILCGEGRFDLASGDALEIPSLLDCQGANWGLFNGSTLKFTGDFPFSGMTVFVEDPEALARAATAVVTVTGSHFGRPKLIYPECDKDKQWRLVWSAEKFGFVVARKPGLVLVVQ